MTRQRPYLILVVLVILSASSAWCQATAIIRGTVLDETGAVVPGARVELYNPMHPKHRMQDETSAEGTFAFYQVPFNPYHLRVEKEGFQTHQETLDVHSPAITLQLVLKVGAVEQKVEVAALLLEERMSTTHISLDEHELERKAGGAPGRLIEEALLESAGVAQNANGRLHVRGAHYQVSFMIDGLPVSDQLSIDFANPFDVRNVEALEFYTGNFPAEFGNKVSGVVNVSTKSGLGSGKLFRGSASGSFGSFDTAEGAAQVGGGTEHWGYFVSIGGGRSHRFLDPPALDNLHNSGNNQSIFLRLDYTPRQSDFLHFSASGARAQLHVPNLPSQQMAGQDQHQRLMDLALRVTWLHVFNPRWSLEIVPYYRTALAQLHASAFDTPVTAAQARHLTTGGAKAAINYAGGGHRFKAGIDFFGLPVSEFLAFGITAAEFNDPAAPEFNPNLLPYDLSRGGRLFQFAARRTGSEYSFFVQDIYTHRQFTASLGLRYDNYNFVLDRDHWSPRLGLAYAIPRGGSVVRFSYNRLFQTASTENLLFSTSPEAAALVPPERIAKLGAALVRVPPEQVDFWELGAQQRVKNWFRVDAAVYWKRIRDYHDNDQLLNTTIVFPIAMRKGRVNGFDLRVDFPARRGVSAYWNFSASQAIGLPPLTGGLFLGEEALELLEAGPFRIDHDQIYTSQGSVHYDHRSGFWTALTGRYDSGLPVEIADVEAIRSNPDMNRELALVNLNDDPFRVKSRLVWDWSLGFNHPHDEPRVSVQCDVRNLTDQQRLYNFLSVFAGTHVIAPRSVSGRIRFHF